MDNENNFLFPDIVAQMHSYWLMGVSGGQILNGHLGYREIAPESTAELLLIEFNITWRKID